jgi:hypothetical protein
VALGHRPPRPSKQDLSSNPAVLPVLGDLESQLTPGRSQVTAPPRGVTHAHRTRRLRGAPFIALAGMGKGMGTGTGTGTWTRSVTWAR